MSVDVREYASQGRLRSLGLIGYPQPRQVVATPVLFLDGERQ